MDVYEGKYGTAKSHSTMDGGSRMRVRNFNGIHGTILLWEWYACVLWSSMAAALLELYKTFKKKNFNT